MNMDLKELQSFGAVAPPRTLVAKTIDINYPVPLPQSQWADPAVAEYPDNPETAKRTLKTHIRKRSSADFIEMVQADKHMQPFVAILRCVCNADGTQVFADIDQVVSLAEWLILPLALAVSEVNDFGPKSSPPRTNSGAKSRSPSAVGRSKSGKNQSATKNSKSGSPTATNAAP